MDLVFEREMLFTPEADVCILGPSNIDIAGYESAVSAMFVSLGMSMVEF